MPLTASVGLSRKIGQENYGSLGAHCQLEMELDTALIDDAEQFHEKIQRLYTLAHQSVVDELERRNGHNREPANGHGRRTAYSAGDGNGNGQRNGHTPTRAPNSRANDESPERGREDTPASNRQIKFLLDLARQQHHMDLSQTARYCEQAVGVGDVYRLTKTQASVVIDQLNNGQAKTNGRR
jgi:hypothetical protein